LHVAAIGPAQSLQRFNESRKVGSVICIVHIHQYADASHALALSTRHQWPRRRAPKRCDESAPLDWTDYHATPLEGLAVPDTTF
jgi:hypothetical protein